MNSRIENRTPSTPEREATIQLSDTFSESWAPEGSPPIADFDSLLTAQVRNSGRWSDLQSPIGAWPHTGNYAAVLLSELRQEQRRLYEIYEKFDRTSLPDAQVLERSLGRSVIGIINWAPRTENHHQEDRNGEDFYLAELGDNVQIFSQLPFLAGVANRGLVQALWRIRDDNPIWPKGEQFRSSIASQLRNFPEGLEQQPLDMLPEADGTGLRLAFADKYGNGRLEKPGGIETPEIAGQRLCLRVDGHELAVAGVNRLTEIPEGHLGIYANPADTRISGTPQYIELARRVSNPNDPRNSAYATLRRTVAPEGSQQHPDWSQVEIELVS